MQKISFLSILLILGVTLAQDLSSLPLPLDFSYTVDDFAFQLGSSEEGTLCTWTGYCVFWSRDSDNCYTYIDTYDTVYYECFDEANNHLSGVQTFTGGYSVEYERQASGYLYWDSDQATWYESFDGLDGYYIQEVRNQTIYYEEWHTDENGTYTYWNSDGAEEIEYASGNYYYYYANGDIEYYDVVNDDWYYFTSSSSQWSKWNYDWYYYQNIAEEPDFYTWEATQADVLESSTSLEDIRSWKVTINETALAQLIEDILYVDSQKVEIFEATVEQIQKDLADSYQRLLGEIIINFGKTVVPIGEAEMEFYRYAVVNEECNMTCGSLCFDPTADETFYLNEGCMDGCGCYFRIQNLTEANVTEDVDDFVESLEDAAETYGEIWNDLVTEITPSIQQFMEMKQEMLEDYAEKLNYHAVNTFGCEETCSNDCTDLEWNYAVDMIPCLAQWCQCDQTPVEVVPSDDFDFPALEEYAGNGGAWDYFLANKNKFQF